MSDDDARKKVAEDFKKFATGKVDEKLWEDFLRRINYISGDFDDPTLYDKLKVALPKIDQEHNSHGNYFFYLATASNYFGDIVERLSKVGLMTEDNSHWRRVIIEKPFGHDLDTAKALNQQLLKVISERQIYRIDHYLGKKRCRIFWPSASPTESSSPSGIAATSITSRSQSRKRLESKTRRLLRWRRRPPRHGAKPHHAADQPCAMEPPISFEANAVRDEQAKILHAIQPFSNEDVLSKTVRGQYGEGTMDGERVPAYRSEEGVPPDSRTETFVAMRLLIDNWRWAGVPFYLRTGKRLPGRNTHVVIQFRRAPFMLFRETPVENMMPNQLVLHIQPEEGISLRFAAKVPGPAMQLGEVNMDFAYADYFGETPNTGYERLLHDCMTGDATLFQRADMVEAGWSIVNPVLDVWKALPPRDFPNYRSGTWGPKESDELMERDGRRWRNFEH